MRTITITITIPEGATVVVGDGIAGDPGPEWSDDALPPPPAASPHRTMATAQPSTAWQVGQQHDTSHKPLKANARGLFCPTKLQDGSWCAWRAS